MKKMGPERIQNSDGAFFWKPGIITRIGKCYAENPDLTYSLIKEILIGLEELEHEKTEYQFG